MSTYPISVSPPTAGIVPDTAASGTFSEPWRGPQRDREGSFESSTSSASVLTAASRHSVASSSPSTNIRSPQPGPHTFVFPIRSVFQSRGSNASASSVGGGGDGSSAGLDPPSKVRSVAGASDSETDPPPNPSHSMRSLISRSAPVLDEPKSVGHPDGDEMSSEDALTSIHQMLKRSHQTPPLNTGPSIATFSGRSSTSGSSIHSTRDSPRLSHPSICGASPLVSPCCSIRSFSPVSAVSPSVSLPGPTEDPLAAAGAALDDEWHSGSESDEQPRWDSDNTPAALPDRSIPIPLSGHLTRQPMGGIDPPPPLENRSSSGSGGGYRSPAFRAMGRAERQTLRDFVNEQAHTVNIPDPNAPTPPIRGRDQRNGSSKAESWGSNQNSDSSNDVGRSDGTSGGMCDFNTRPDSGEDAWSETVSEPLTTMRSEYIATDEGHQVIQGPDMELTRCEDEPIRTPGAVQGFGVMVLLEEDLDTGNLVVRGVSENSTELLGLSPRYLFRLSCFSRILTIDQEDVLRDHIEYLPEPAEDPADAGGHDEDSPVIFLLAGFGEPGSADLSSDDTSVGGDRRRREWSCWVAAHRPAPPVDLKYDIRGEPIVPPDLIILELELERDEYNPLVHPDYEGSSRAGTSTTSMSGSDGGEYGALRGGRPTAAAFRGPDSQGSVSQGAPTSSNSTAPSSQTPHADSVLLTPTHDAPSLTTPSTIDAHLENVLASTENFAKPLRALERLRRADQHASTAPTPSLNSVLGGARAANTGRRARAQTRRARDRGGQLDAFALINQINDQLGAATDMDTFLKVAVGLVQDLTHFHRIMIYRFDDKANGEVVAELIEWGRTMELFKGLWFPAGSIPPQARELYRINRVRFVYDRSQQTARLVVRAPSDLIYPIDMTNCFLRAMSPIHLQYLSHMQVRSSMSISIMAFGKLWGLVIAHSFGDFGMRSSFPVRQILRVFSDSISRNVERILYAKRLARRKLISSLPTDSSTTGYIMSNADDLLSFFDADCGVLVINDGCKPLGHFEQAHEMITIAEYLRMSKFDALRTSSSISEDFPDLLLPQGPDAIAGFLYIPLTPRAGQDFLVFFRKSQESMVRWAGNPYKDTGALVQPLPPWKMWSEKIVGRSRTWDEDQVEAAGVLALIYGKFIQVWRERQNAMVSSQLTAILLSNTSHAVRTPLSQIINTLELALAGNIDSDTRSMLENSHQASRALLFHVHDLLDLTRVETGNELGFNDPFDLRQTITDTVRLYHTESTRRGIAFNVSLDDDIPPMVVGDPRKIKTVISNLIGNAVKFTSVGSIEVSAHKTDGESMIEMEADEAHPRYRYVPIEITVTDTGCGIPAEQLDAMFVTLEGAEDRTEAGLGLGLAVVARIVEQLAGQLCVESEVGKGTTFSFTLNMEVYEGPYGPSLHNLAAPGLNPIDSSPQLPPGSQPSPDESLPLVPLSTPGRPPLRRSLSGSRVSLQPPSFLAAEAALEVATKQRIHMIPGQSSMAPGSNPADPEAVTHAPDLTEQNSNPTRLSPTRRLSAQLTKVVLPSPPPSRPLMVHPVAKEVSLVSRVGPAEQEAELKARNLEPAPAPMDAAVAVVPAPADVPPPARSPVSLPGPTSQPAPKASSALRQAPKPVTAVPAVSAKPVPAPVPIAVSVPAALATTTVPEAPATGAPVEPKPLGRVKRGPNGEQKLRVLVVEDDVVNSQILQRRLRMDKHVVKAVENGQEAVDALRADWDMDVVLMDIQMPIMDGRTAAFEIRKLEGVTPHRHADINPLLIDGRIPIFAVSASLYDEDRVNLAPNFDGWLLKPLDFTRVRALLSALEDDQKRDAEVYRSGHWERGGYFRGRPGSGLGVGLPARAPKLTA